MNADEDFGFDVSGFIHVPQVLSAAQVAACNAALDAVGEDEGMLERPAPWCDAFAALQEHPVLQRYLEAVCGPGFAMDRAPAMIAPNDEANAGVPLSAGDPQRNRRLRYVNDGEVRVCHGVRVVWALAPADAVGGGIVLVPASHHRWFEPPSDVLRGTDDLGMTVEPKLQPGDMLLCAATLVHGVRGRPGRLMESHFVSARMMPSAGYGEVPAPDWTKDLTAEQMTVVGPRTSGQCGALLSNGQRAWVAKTAEQPHRVEDIQQEDFAPDPKELWFWDVRGYLVLRGVMDKDWLAAAHGAIDAAIANQPNLPEGHLCAFEEVPEAILRESDWQWPPETSARIRGDINRPRIGGLYHLPPPHCEPFRKMLAHAPVVQRLNWMLGLGFRESFEPMCCIYPKGTTGGSLHGQSVGSYRMINGRPRVDSVNVAWALHDEAPGFGDDSGGFVCVPGSQKGRVAIPRPKTTSIDLPQVHKPALKAGDVLFFGGVIHGTTAWRSDWDRRTVIQFMCANTVSVRPADEAVGWRWSRDETNPTNVLSEKER